jgi:hypothetical protein
MAINTVVMTTTSYTTRWDSPDTARDGQQMILYDGHCHPFQ